MAKLIPDQTFYPSPKMAMEAAPEKLAYVAILNPTTNDGTDAMAVVDLDPSSKTYGTSSAAWTCRTPATSCIISAGTPAVPACVRTRRIRTWSGAT